ncbi:MAG: hypothetical protein II916_09795 [Oscillospiraceae bacterium]|nr:hypothetical protein [Oscillospiraceae bacterium]
MENTIITTGFINDSGALEIPGVYFEDGQLVDVTITVMPGKLQVAIYPPNEDDKGNDLCEECRERFCEGFLDES